MSYTVTTRFAVIASDFLLSLNVNDKLDVNVNNDWWSYKPLWKVGIIVKKRKSGKRWIKLLISYDESGKKMHYEIELKLNHSPKRIFDKVDKLHSHTTFTSEELKLCRDYKICSESKIKLNSASCSMCNILTYIVVKCSECKIYCCKQCIYNGICNGCMTLNELNNICTVIISVNGIHHDIAWIIAEYGIGHIIDCCNYKRCGNQIIIDNEFMFRKNINKYCFYNIKLYQYILNRKCKNNKIHRVYGKYRRFSCDIYMHCQTKRCSMKYCSNKDAVFDVCLDHAKCAVCDNKIRSTPSTCISCNNYHCYKCGYQNVCKLCHIRNEFNVIVISLDKAIQTIMEQNIDMNIINIIAFYSIGAIIKCSGSYCRKKIFINNEFEFLYQKIDFSVCKIYHYAPKIISSFKCNELSKIYGKYRRVFCSNCLKRSSLNKCLYGDCKNYDVRKYCGDHRQCSQCQALRSNGYIVCRSCNNYCCDNWKCNGM